MTIQIFEEGNRLYVEITDAPKDLKDKLAAFATDGICNALEGLVPKQEEAPKAPKKEESKPVVDDDWADETPAKTEPVKEEPKSEVPANDSWVDDVPNAEEPVKEETSEKSADDGWVNMNEGLEEELAELAELTEEKATATTEELEADGFEVNGDLDKENPFVAHQEEPEEKKSESAEKSYEELAADDDWA